MGASAGQPLSAAASAGGPANPGQQALVLGNLKIRPDEIQALADGRRVGLTVREFQVLLVLARARTGSCAGPTYTGRCGVGR